MHCAFLSDANGRQLNRVFVQYSFDRHKHSVELMPHGNSKSKKPFSRTKPSIIHCLKESAQSKTSQKVLREIENEQGGVMGAKSVCDLP